MRRTRQLPARVNVQRDLERKHPLWDPGDLISAIFSNVSEVINVWLLFIANNVLSVLKLVDTFHDLVFRRLVKVVTASYEGLFLVTACLVVDSMRVCFRFSHIFA